MQYFQAVQEGKRRAAKSQMRLFDAAGFAMLTLTTKKISGRFVPVGEEEYAATIHTPEGYVVILADADGYTKAQSKAVERSGASDIYGKLVEGGAEPYPGDTITIWTRTHPVIR
ncbi:MAG: hypothetical protein J4G04_05460 [Nitrosopumilaceae archaeon]|nr:hypothetical protein [Nitrosopumilaceae archaeon]